MKRRKIWFVFFVLMVALCNCVEVFSESACITPNFLSNTAKTAAPVRPTHEIIFVDQRVPERDSLLADFANQVDNARRYTLITLDPTRDGIEQVGNALQNQTPLDAIHFITHGIDGVVQLGGTELDSDTIGKRAGLIKSWGKALTAGGDILFYGCDLAATQRGQALIEALAQLTGADVAASNDTTGHPGLGADWELEFKTGAIETPVLVSKSTQHRWHHLLNTYTVTNTSDSGAGSLRQAIINANGNAGADTIAFSISAAGSVQTINLLSALDPISDPVTIDGWTQGGVGYTGPPLIELNGAAVAGHGLDIQDAADGTTIRGLVINRFGTDGIQVRANAVNITIVGNYIGTDVTGMLAGFGNGDDGIDLNPGSTSIIGGTTAAERNVISGNSDEGVIIETDGAILQGNYIGTQADGIGTLGNSGDGIRIYLAYGNNLIGGTAAGAGNIIANSGVLGIRIDDPAALNNSILHNSIYNNSSPGIDLGTTGVTNNDAGDGDAGANYLQNYPGIDSAVVSGSWVTISGHFNNIDGSRTRPNSTYSIEFFANPAAATGREGRTYLGSLSVTTDANGDATFTSVPLDFTGYAAGDRVTATATMTASTGGFAAEIGSTSEFSASFVTTAGAGSLLAYWNFNEGSGQTAADSAGSNDGTLGTTPGVDAQDPAWSCGSSDAALDFDGSDDEVRLSSVTIGDRAAFTISAWFQIGPDSADQRTIYSEGTLATTEYLFVYVDDSTNGVRFYSVDSSGSNYGQLQGTSNVEDNTWHNVIVVQRSKTDRELYVDGLSEDTDTNNAGTYSFDTASIGYLRTDWVADPFLGLIDDVRIYDYALSPAEISALAASPPTGTCGSTPAVTSAEAEIAPNNLTTGSTANAFNYDIQVTIGGGDSGVDRVAITVPATFGTPTVTDVQVGGVPVAYTDNTSGNDISVDLAAKVAASNRITVLFDADAPGSQDLIGVDFLSTVDDSGTADAPQATTEGNGDGDGLDNNSWTVTTGDPIAASCPPAGQFFSDGFESDDLSAWNGSTTGTGDTIGTSSVQANTGTYSARAEVDNAATGRAFVFKDFAGQTTVYAKNYIYLDPAFAIGINAEIMYLSDGVAPQILAAHIKNDMTINLWNQVAGENYATATTISKGVWHTVEMMAVINGASSEARLWLDGNLEIVQTGIDLGTNPITRFSTGYFWSNPADDANIVYVDDVTLCTPSPGVTISGTVYHDINANNSFDAGELGIGLTWVKLISGGSVVQVVPADPDSGAYTLTTVPDGSYTLIVDDNNLSADSTPTAPVNWQFQSPATGSLAVNVSGSDVTDQNLGLVFQFDLAADCNCGYDDGMLSQATITIDGNISDWGAPLSDLDNNSCDATDDTDRDYPLQSTGRNLLRTAATYDGSYFAMWTQRIGSSNNTQNFIYYADTNNDGIMSAGEPVIVAKWQGNTGNVTLEKYSYDDLGSGGDPLLDADGYADGYSMPGDLTFIKTISGADGGGQGSTTGNTDGTQMEWKVSWAELGIAPGGVVSWHIASTNANPGAAGLSAQIDDNVGGCGGQCTGSNQFGGVLPAPITLLPGQTVYLFHQIENTGNGNDAFDIEATDTGAFAITSYAYYLDLGTVGVYEPGTDTLLADTTGSGVRDTGTIAPAAIVDIIVAADIPAGADGTTFITTTATSNFVPGCGATVTPVSGDVVDTLVIRRISGTVYEDVDGDADLLDAVGVALATVRLYADDGDDLPDAGDGPAVDTTTTDGSGNYSFENLSDGTYWVAVDSRTISPSGGLLGALGDVWAEQTYGVAGARCDNGSGTTVEIGIAGACFSGQLGDRSDDAAAGVTSSEHLTRVVVSGSSVNFVDSAFSFNVVTNTLAGDAQDDDGGNNRSVQGSLRQFIQNANGVSGPNAMRFVPAVPTNATDGGGNNWWRITVTQVLPAISEADTTIDGTAYDLADGTTIRNTNAALLGYVGPVGLGADATAGTGDEPALSGVQGPEFEIVEDGASQVDQGLDLQANNLTIRRLSIHGFGDDNPNNADLFTEADIRIGTAVGSDAGSAFTGILVEDNVIGSGPAALADPGASNQSVTGIAVYGPDNGTIQRNVIAYAGRFGVFVSNDANGWAVQSNDIRENALSNYAQDGIDLGNLSGGTNISGNYFYRNWGGGLDSYRGDGGNLIENNSFLENGRGQTEPSAIRLFGTGSTVRLNLIQNNGVVAGSPPINRGSGVLLVRNDGTTNSPSSGNLISQNSFGSNISNAIDLVSSSGDNSLGDGITLNDSATDANAGNIGLDYPVITSAALNAGTTTISGTACAGCEVEVYLAIAGSGDTNAGTDYGEGVTYIATDTADGSGNWSLTTTALAIGNDVSAITIDGANNTSEFGANFTVTGDNNISGTVYHDVDADADIAEGGTLTFAGATVHLYQDSGNAVIDGGETLIATTATDGTGNYSFGGLADGTYYIVLDSTTLAATGYNGGFTIDDVWAEQTYAVSGAASGAGFTATAGAMYGGRNPDTSDDPTDVTSAEHVIRRTIVGADATGVNFGFSFNAVINIRGDATDDDGGGTNRLQQGTLRQFILNANAINGSNAMRFVPAVATNESGGGGNWWTITVAAVLPIIGDADTTIDGTAYDSIDGVTVLETNAGQVGIGGFVGVDNLVLDRIDRPELELDGGGAIAADGLVVDAGSVTIRNLALNRFGPNNYDAQIQINNAVTAAAGETIITGNLVGTNADGSDSGGNERMGIFVLGAATLTNNYIAYVEGNGLSLSSFNLGIINTEPVNFTNNEIAFSSFTGSSSDAISDVSAGAVIRGNAIHDHSGAQPALTLRGKAIEIWYDVQGVPVENNTVANMQVAGIGLNDGASNCVIRRNIVTGTTGVGGEAGAGILISSYDYQSPPGMPGASRITENSIYDNFGLGIDLDVRTGAIDHTWFGDGVTPNDANDGDTGANALQNFPVLDWAATDGSQVRIFGTLNSTATMNFRLEFFASPAATADPSGYGEGQRFIGNTDVTTDGSGDATFNVLLASAVAAGEVITATATRADAGFSSFFDTSEFAQNVTVSAASNITGTIYHDVDADADVAEGGTLNFANPSVVLYLDDGDSTIDAGDGLLASTTTDGNGDFTFGVYPDGTYYVAADSKTLAATGYNGGFDINDVWAEQTYAVSGAASGAGFTAADGALYGGRNAATSDDAAALTSAEHVIQTTISGADVNGVNFGFSFNAIVNTRGDDVDDDGGGTNRLQQGSLRQFILNSNAISATQTSEFAIGAEGSSQTIAPASVLPTISDAVILDGWTQAAVGYTGPPLIEINGNGAAAGTIGLTISASDSTVRGLIINRFPDDGIRILAGGDRNTIVGNYIGTDASGMLDLGNGNEGVEIRSADNIIGGPAATDRNIISGNAQDGISITGAGATGNQVQGNYIGVNVNADAAIANNQEGIRIDGGASGNTIGGVGLGNVVAGNIWGGIRISGAGSDSNVVQGNWFGTNTGGVLNLGQGYGGIEIDNGASSNLIGGVNAGEGNLIAFSDDDGLLVYDSGGHSVNNTILGNRIFSNDQEPNGDGIGIDLAAVGDIDVAPSYGITANDAGDADTGLGYPNEAQNYPVLTAAITNGTTVTITGSLNSTANTNFRIEFFANSAASPSGHGEGERYLGFANVTTDGTGNVSFSPNLTASVVVGEAVSATATRSNATFTQWFDTSEFAANVTATASSAISGTVFEDINYGGGNGRDYAAADTSAQPSGWAAGAIGSGAGVVVELYEDQSGNFIKIDDTTTDANGDYTFTDLADNTYRVRVVNTTVPSNRGSNGTGNTPLAVQTFRNDPDSGGGVTDEVGGASPSSQDAAAQVDGTDLSSITAQSVTEIVVSGADVINVDFGFNFDTIVNTADTGQGSLRQFLFNSNELNNTNLDQQDNPAGVGAVSKNPGDEHSIFMIPAAELAATIDGGGGTVMLIQTAGALPTISDDDTAVDGSTQTAYTGDSNNAVAETTTGPEVIVDLQGAAADVISINADFVIIDGLGLTGNAADGNECIDINVGKGSAILRNNTVFSTGASGIKLQNGSSNNQILNNVMLNVGVDSVTADGFAFGGNNTGNTISGNQIIASAGYGIDVVTDGGNDNNTFSNNLIKGNGTSGSQLAGIAFRGGDNNTVSQNTITENAGEGIFINDADTGNRITQNSIFNNGALGADMNAVSGTAGDGVSANDNLDPDTGGNNRQNFPLITSAVWNGANTVIQGTLNSTAGATFDIEVFSNTVCNGDTSGVAQADPYGEGESYRATDTIGTDGSGDGSFSVSIPVDLTGQSITATATNTATNDTSEFSQCETVVAALAISGTVYEDVNGDANLADGVTRDNVTVALFRDGGDNQPDSGDDTFVTTTTTDGVGNYAFSGLAPATYWVAVDSRTVRPNAGYNVGFALGDVWAEQTYGIAGSWCADGASGTAELGAAGACYGG